MINVFLLRWKVYLAWMVRRRSSSVQRLMVILLWKMLFPVGRRCATCIHHHCMFHCSHDSFYISFQWNSHALQQLNFFAVTTQGQGFSVLALGSDTCLSSGGYVHSLLWWALALPPFFFFFSWSWVVYFFFFQ